MGDINMENQDFNTDLERIKELISLSERKKNSGEIKKYKEENTKEDFILPLFEALRWDVYSRIEKGSAKAKNPLLINEEENLRGFD